MVRGVASATIVTVVCRLLWVHVAADPACPVSSQTQDFPECLCGVGNRTYECVQVACSHIADPFSALYVECENAVLSMPTRNLTVENFPLVMPGLSSDRENVEVDDDTSTASSATRRRLALPDKYAAEYNFLHEMPACNPPIRFQDKCYNCYDQAASTTAAMSMCKKTGVRFYASVAYLTLCHPRIGNRDLRCDFNLDGPKYAFNRITRFSLVHDQCLPEGSAFTPRARPPLRQKCPDKCANGDPFTKHIIVPPSEIHNFKIIRGGEEPMKEQLYANGALGACSQHTTNDFLKLDFRNKPDTVWTCTAGAEPIFAHCVTMYGWGEEQGTKYWHFISSFGYNWGTKGHARIRRGQNDCDIEQSLVFYIQFGTPTTTLTPPPDVYAQQEKEDGDEEGGDVLFTVFMVLLGIFLCACCVGAAMCGVYFWKKNNATKSKQGRQYAARASPSSRPNTSPRAHHAQGANSPLAARTPRHAESMNTNHALNKKPRAHKNLPAATGTKQRAKQ